VPEELTFFVVTGLSESTNRLRTFPNIDFLGIPDIPGNGTTIDYGHQNNNLADNNNNKAFGGRMVFALGDLRFPWPIPEGASDLKGVNLGLSGMGGQYDLEGTLNYSMFAADWSFDYFGFALSGEYEYSTTQFKDTLLDNTGAVVAPVQHLRDFEVNQGYFIQASAPILRSPRIGQRVTGVAVFNQMWRRGPIQDLLLNQVISGTNFPSVNGLRPDSLRATTRMDKYTVGVNYQLTDHFTFKFDYSYWVMAHASTRSVTSIGNLDIYQGAFSMVMAF
jgi:hypothetical protein